jgi:prepilin-type N-terminal cleavage/methylation domain-containing protein
LKKLVDKKRRAGFTIVELLIVIVVIGILAAIVIIAYMGIQERARSTKFGADVRAIISKAEAYKVLNDVYPNGVDNTCITFSPNPEATLPQNITVFYFHFPAAQPSDLDYNTVVGGATDGYTSVPGCPATPVFGATYCDPSDLGGGMKIFYPDTVNKSVKMLIAGTCP